MLSILLLPSGLKEFECNDLVQASELPQLSSVEMKGAHFQHHQISSSQVLRQFVEKALYGFHKE